MTAEEVLISSGQMGQSRGGLGSRFSAAFRAFSTGFQSPGMPLEPMPPPDGMSEDEWGPRTFSYMAGRNLIAGPRSDEAQLSTFAMLRKLGDAYDIGRICIDYVKDQISSTPFDIVSRSVIAGDSDEAPPTGVVRLIKDFLSSPDREHTFEQWVKIALEEMLVVDALAVYRRKTLGGDPYSLEIIAGDTIKPLIDGLGRRPDGGLPAYQQTLYGVAFDQFAADELIYLPMNPRASSVYGFSPLERMLLNINTALRKQMFELKWFTEGNTPDALLGFSMGNATPSQTKAFQQFIDDRLKGDDSNRRGITVVPIPTGDASGAGSKMDLIKFVEPVWERHLEEWMVQVTCAALYTTPSEIGFLHQTNRSTGASQENAQERRLHPLYVHLARLFTNHVCKGIFGEDDLEFRWLIQPPVEDMLKLAQVDDLNVRGGRRSIDELRERDGLSPKGMDKLILVSQSSVSLVDDLEKLSALTADPPPKPVTAPSFGGSKPSVAGATPVSRPPGAPGPTAKSDDAAGELRKLNAFLAKGSRRPFVPTVLSPSLVKAIEAQSAVGSLPDTMAAARVLVEK